MKITSIHRNSPIELRFTIVDGERETVRMIFAKETAPALEVAGAIADNINHYVEMREAGFPYDFNQYEHIARIMKDAPYYGTD